MTIVSYAQMMHPKREEGAARVREQLGRPIEIFIDQTDAGPWQTAKRAWAATPADCRWRCLLQDDIDLAPGFAEALELLVVAHGDPMGSLRSRPLALYNGLTDFGDVRRLPADLPRADEHWIARVDGVQGPALAIAQRDVGPMLEWCARFVRETPDMYSADIRPSLWLEANGRTSLSPVPSWVQHRGAEPSLLGTPSYGSMPRTSQTFDPEFLRRGQFWKGLDAPATYGERYGASSRVRWKLWRTWQEEPDHVLESSGIDPRAGMPVHRGGLARPGGVV